MLTLTQWIHQTKEQSDNVNLLVNMMKESCQVQNKLREDVEAMAIQVRLIIIIFIKILTEFKLKRSDKSDENARIQMGGWATGLSGGRTTKPANDSRSTKRELEIEGDG